LAELFPTEPGSAESAERIDQWFVRRNSGACMNYHEEFGVKSGSETTIGSENYWSSAAGGAR